MSKDSITIGFELFLKTLDAESSGAAEKYLILRERLERFFEWRDFENVEELTDIVFDRVVKKIAEGEKIENAEAFCISVAKFLLPEKRREDLQKVELDENSREIVSGEIEKDSIEEELIKSKRFDCLDKCLAEFPPDKRKLLIGYFDTDEETLIPKRKKLAENLGVNLNSLRIRISRLKTKLENCTKKCCDEK